jgi:hypothetical protein
MKTLLSIASVIAIASAVPATAQSFDCNGTCYAVQTNANSGGIQDTDVSLDGNTIATSALEVTFDLNPGTAFFTGTSSADLSQGAVRGFIDTNFGGGVSASLYEVLMFDLPDGVDSLEVPVTWTFEGSTDFEGGFPNGLYGYFRLTTFSNLDTVEFADLNVASNPIWEEGTYLFTFTDMLTINEVDLYQLQMSLGLAMIGTGTLDYGNTAYFNIDLPQGVSLISSSGVLLSDPIRQEPGAVPEPATWATLVVGFGAVGYLVRRARRRDHSVLQVA